MAAAGPCRVRGGRGAAVPHPPLPIPPCLHLLAPPQAAGHTIGWQAMHAALPLPPARRAEAGAGCGGHCFGVLCGGALLRGAGAATVGLCAARRGPALPNSRASNPMKGQPFTSPQRWHHHHPSPLPPPSGGHQAAAAGRRRGAGRRRRAGAGGRPVPGLLQDPGGGVWAVPHRISLLSGTAVPCACHTCCVLASCRL